MIRLHNWWCEQCVNFKPPLRAAEKRFSSHQRRGYMIDRHDASPSAGLVFFFFSLRASERDWNCVHFFCRARVRGDDDISPRAISERASRLDWRDEFWCKEQQAWQWLNTTSWPINLQRIVGDRSDNHRVALNIGHFEKPKWYKIVGNNDQCVLSCPEYLVFI